MGRVWGTRHVREDAVVQATVSYTKAVDVHFWSKNAHCYPIHRHKIDRVMVLFFCVRTERSTDVLWRPTKPAAKKFNKLPVDYGTMFDGVVDCIAAGISSGHVARSMLVSTCGQESKLSGCVKGLWDGTPRRVLASIWVRFAALSSMQHFELLLQSSSQLPIENICTLMYIFSYAQISSVKTCTTW